MTLQKLLERICGIYYAENPEEIKCTKEDCHAYGRKPICYMEWAKECCYRDWQNDISEWRRSFVE